MVLTLFALAVMMEDKLTWPQKMQTAQGNSELLVNEMKTKDSSRLPSRALPRAGSMAFSQPPRP